MYLKQSLLHIGKTGFFFKFTKMGTKPNNKQTRPLLAERGGKKWPGRGAGSKPVKIQNVFIRKCVSLTPPYTPGQSDENVEHPERISAFRRPTRSRTSKPTPDNAIGNPKTTHRHHEPNQA